MSDAADAARARLLVGAMVARDYANNPVDLERVAQAIDGGRNLLGYASEHLAAGRKAKALQILRAAVSAMSEAHDSLMMDYTLSGDAAEDMLSAMRDSLRRDRDEGSL